MSRIEVRQTYAQQPFISQVPGLKADSLVLFGYYFKWPADAVPGNEFVIGLLGNPTFPRQRVTATFDKVGNRKIRVLTFDSAQDYQPCHILYVAEAATEGSEEKTPAERLAAAVKKINGAPVLVVTEKEGFAKRGAMVNFVVDENANRLKTEVNLAALQKGRISVTKYFVNFSQTDKCILLKED